MERGKHEKGNLKYKKSLGLLAALLLLLTVTVGGTVAYFLDSTDTVTNTFVPVSVKADITESFDHQTKSSVVITNEGTIPTFVRAAAVMYWTDANGVIVQPENCSNTPLVLGEGWFAVGSVYYYGSSVAVGGATGNLLAQPITATISPENSNYVFHLEVHTEAIQASPTDAVEAAWKDVNVSGGKLVAAGG